MGNTLLQAKRKLGYMEHGQASQQSSLSASHAGTGGQELDTHLLELRRRLSDFFQVLLEIQLNARISVLLFLDEDEFFPGLANLFGLLIFSFICKRARSS